MENRPLLSISDGTTTISLVDLHGWLLKEWKPEVSAPKGGGVFRDSPLIDGRKLVFRRSDNIIDTFNLVGNEEGQDSMIRSIQELQRLLEKAVAYWTADWQNQPVYISVRAPNETNTRYATIMDYRFTGFGGPFQQPFFSSACDSTTEAILAIEHSFWQETIPGEDGTCVQLSNQKYEPSVSGFTTAGPYEPGAEAQDGTFSRWASGDIGNITAATLEVGYGTLLTGLSEIGIIFNNVAVPAEAVIIKAELTLTEVAYAGDAGACALVFRGQHPANGDATDFTGTNSDFFSRTRTQDSSFVYLEANSYPGTVDVTNIVQEIVGPINAAAEPTGWASGDDMCFMINLTSPGVVDPTTPVGRVFHSFSGTTPPTLTIYYSSSGAYVGRSATCLQEVYVSNKQVSAQLTHAFVYDDSGATFTSNLLSTVLPYDLLPATPAVGDYVIFISDTGTPAGGLFNNLIFDFGIAMEGVVGKWQYYDGAAWQDFDVSGSRNSDLAGDQIGLATLGVGSVVWKQEVGNGDWAQGTFNIGGTNYTGWAVRFLVTAVNAPVPPQQQNRQLYTVTRPYVEVDELQVPGDIAPLARIMFDAANNAGGRSMNNMTMGLRSMSRGSDFSAYLNCSDQQQPPGIICKTVTPSHFDSNIEAPTGRSVHMNGFDPGIEGAWGDVLYWSFGSGMTEQYIGTYHAYLRGVWGIIPSQNIRFRLKAVFGKEYNVSYSDIGIPQGYAFPEYGYMPVVDLGQITIQPNYSLRPADYVRNAIIYLQASTYETVSWGLVWANDVVLIPSDEWIGTFGMPTVSGATLSYGDGLDIDAITNPRLVRATQLTRYVNSPSFSLRSVTAEWSKVMSGDPVFQANRDQRLWFFQHENDFNPGDVTPLFMWSRAENLGKISAQRSARYLLARGNR